METNEFKSLFLPFQPKMYRTAYALLRNRQDAEDIVQEAFMKLWKKRNDMDILSIGEAYCVTMIKNLCIDFLRISHVNQEDAINENILYKPDNDAERNFELRDEAKYLRKLMYGLPDIQRKVILLRDINGLSFEEIEKLTGLGAVNIRATLSKARKRIREQFNVLINRK